MTIHNFSTDGVKNLNTCVLDFCVMSVVWSPWVHSSFYGGLIQFYFWTINV